MIKIGLTKSEIAFDNYPRWILNGNDLVEVVVLDIDRNNLKDLDLCHGVLLSGGVDIHPSYYNESRIDYPLAPIFNPSRDEFELKIFNLAYSRGLPLLGICRGMQLMNVALGGHLTQDLEEIGSENHRKNQNNDRIHTITIDTTSQLYKIGKLENGQVNSAHHQGLKELGSSLKDVAWSVDGVIEAIELVSYFNYSYFLGVQWHPERFVHDTYAKPFSIDIKNSFLNACILR